MSKPTPYLELHQLFNRLPRYTFSYQKQRESGLYVFFEEGEKYKNLDRMVWVGTHFGEGKLYGRIDDHYGSNQRLSMLRKHIGRCLLIKSGREEYVPTWNLGIMSNELRRNKYPQIDWVLEGEMEEQITEYLQQHFSFAILPGLSNYSQRKRWVAGIIAILAQSRQRSSSDGWLGNLHQHPRIRESKVWNFQYQQSPQLSQEELAALRNIFRQIKLT